MKNGEKLTCAQALVQVLEKEGVKLIFGHPGEQILPFYDALRTSPIEHVLFRHEQGAAHAADGYARFSGHPGFCVATAGPGALNLVMGVGTAYKDSVPLLVITGDVNTTQQGQNVFQDINLKDIFNPITRQGFYPRNPAEAVLNLKEALKILKNGPTGPVHLNLPKDVLSGEVDSSILQQEVNYEVKKDIRDLKKALEMIKAAKKPLLVAGAGIIWADAVDDVKNLVEKHNLPLVTTYPARGVLGEDHPLCLGMIGTRGTPVGNFAGRNADLIVGLGCRFSERTLAGIGEGPLIQVNLDSHVLKGDLNLQMDVKKFIDIISPIPYKTNSTWLNQLKDYSHKNPAEYNILFNYPQMPLKPQQAIKEIIEASKGVLVNDAGTHTTWVTLYKKVLKPGHLIFSGGFGPMGYALPGALGAALAIKENEKKDKKKIDELDKGAGEKRIVKNESADKEGVIAITGDGSFQMTLQELATLKQEKLPLIICIINNQSLGIIRQWQELYHSGPYEVGLDNPDFVKLAQSYDIQAVRVDSPGEVFKAVKYGLSLKKPFLIDIMVDPEENIPLPKIFSAEK